MASQASFVFAAISIFCLCGCVFAKEAKIVAGYEAAVGQFPHQAIVVMSYPNVTGVGVCGGSLISCRFVLTAAHCLGNNPSYIRVLLGFTTRLAPNKYKVERYASHFTYHDKFNKTTLRNDIGLLLLNSTALVNDFVKPIRISMQESNCLYGKILAVSGFGSILYRKGEISTVLKYTYLKAIPHEECLKTLDFLSKRVICTVSPSQTNITNICMGDSGGPLTTNKTLVGIVSFITVPDNDTSGTCEQRSPSGFTLVWPFHNWIWRAKRHLLSLCPQVWDTC